MQTKKVLVIGPESRLAKQFTTLLKVETGFELVTAGKYASADHYLDLASVSQLSSAFLEGDYKYALVFGGMTKIAQCEENPDLAQDVNCDAVLRLLDILKVEHWLLFSTNLVFDGNRPNTPKDSPYSAINAYGRSKVAMEEGTLNSGKSVAVLRMTKVIQPNMELFEGFVDQLSRGASIEVFDDMLLAPVRSSDLMAYLLSLLHNFREGIHQLSGAEDFSYFDAVRYCAQKLGFDEDLIHAVPKNIKYPKYTSLKVDRLEHGQQFVVRSLNEVFDEYLELSNWYPRNKAACGE